MTGKWPRGSEWRKWDLHIHSPETKLSDAFKPQSGANVWDEYCRRLEESDVQVFGITDYFSADGYLRAMKEFSARYPKSSKMLFPNIELRTSYVVNKAREEVNVHVIFNPFAADCGNTVTKFLHALRTNKTVGDDKSVMASDLSKREDFEEATTTREFIRDALWAVYGKQAHLTEHVLIVTAANNDGIRAESGVKRKEGISDELDKASHAFFGNSGNVEWYLKPDRYANKTERSEAKPTISGSDAHSFADLDAKLGKTLVEKGKVIFEPTWIKADPTFDGLRQILFEPRGRVHIGYTPPLYHDEARAIRAVRLSNTNGWFDAGEIPLNQGLVSIIGQKGSGKSALAELMAYAAGSWNTTEAGSFLRRAGQHLKDLMVELVWKDGPPTVQRIGAPQTDAKRVRYLSQKFVERLCADDHIGGELIREIEAVIFEHTDPTDTLGASSFDELRASRTESIRADRNDLREEMTRLIREECALADNKKTLSEKKARIKTLVDEEAGLLKQMPKPANEEEKRIQAELQGKRAALAAVQQEVGGYKQQLQKIGDIRAKVNALKGQMTRFATDIEALLRDAGIPEGERAAFKPVFATDTEAPLVRHGATLQKMVTDKEGTDQNPTAGTIRALEKEIKALTERESNDKARQQKIKSIQTRLAAITSEVKKLNDEIAQIEGPQRKRRDKCREERLVVYGAYFDNLRREQNALEDLYKPVKKKLGSSDTKAAELEFSIRWEADIANWLERGGKLFDQRKTNPYGTMDQLAKAARETLLPAWLSGDAEKIKAALTKFLEPFRNPEMPPRTYVRNDVTMQDLFEWVYEVDHVRLNYGLKYNGTEIEKLSPGTKGIVLLILYLGMDTADTRPLIVDQPDENLDNESIYDMLRTYFENAKSRRQIILISHNPNLVVNADSEQVIVATCDRQANDLPHITYKMGSLENSVADGTGIRQRACRILEGGEVAFQRREGRYAIPRKAASTRSGAEETDSASEKAVPAKPAGD